MYIKTAIRVNRRPAPFVETHSFLGPNKGHYRFSFSLHTTILLRRRVCFSLQQSWRVVVYFFLKATQIFAENFILLDSIAKSQSIVLDSFLPGQALFEFGRLFLVPLFGTDIATAFWFLLVVGMQ